MLSDESSRPRGDSRRAKRGAAPTAPICAAIVSSSQSPLACWRAQGDGWSAISISTSVLRACCTGSTFGLDHHARLALADAGGGVDAGADVDDADAADADRGLVLLVAERRDRDPVEPGGVEDRRPRGTVTSRPSMVSVTSCSRSRRRGSDPEADAGRAAALAHVRLDLVGEVLHHRRDRHGHDLAEAADRGQAQRVDSSS